MKNTLNIHPSVQIANLRKKVNDNLQKDILKRDNIEIDGSTFKVLDSKKDLKEENYIIRIEEWNRKDWTNQKSQFFLINWVRDDKSYTELTSIYELINKDWKLDYFAAVKLWAIEKKNRTKYNEYVVQNWIKITDNFDQIIDIQLIDCTNESCIFVRNATNIDIVIWEHRIQDIYEWRATRWSITSFSVDTVHKYFEDNTTTTVTTSISLNGREPRTDTFFIWKEGWCVKTQSSQSSWIKTFWDITYRKNSIDWWVYWDLCSIKKWTKRLISKWEKYNADAFFPVIIDDKYILVDWKRLKKDLVLKWRYKKTV